MHATQRKLLRLAKDRQLAELSLQEIAVLINENYRQSVKHHLHQLVVKGFLIKDQAGQYGVVEHGNHATDSRPTLVSIPILGSANAGPATFFADDAIDGYLRVSSDLLNYTRSLFAVRVIGDSMNKASIHGQTAESGDYVVVDQNQKAPSNGEYVLSLINDMANIKRFYRDGVGAICLVSESTERVPPILVSEDQAAEYFVLGKIIRVIKSFQKNVA